MFCSTPFLGIFMKYVWYNIGTVKCAKSSTEKCNYIQAGLLTDVYLKPCQTFMTEPCLKIVSK